MMLEPAYLLTQLSALLAQAGPDAIPDSSFFGDLMKYLGVLGALVGSAFGLPIPEEVPIITGGVLVGKEWNNPNTYMHWWIMLPLCIVGVVVTDAILYFIGRRWGPRLLRSAWVQRRLLPADKRQKIEDNFHKYGIGILLVARITPGIRTPIFLMSGMLRLPFKKFLLADGIYAIPGVNLLFWLSYWFTDQFQRAFHRVSENKHLVMAVILAAVGGFLAYSLLIKRRVSTGSPEDIPVVGDRVASTLSHMNVPVSSERIEKMEQQISGIIEMPKPEAVPETPTAEMPPSLNGAPEGPSKIEETGPGR
jgi:membrane protein DedA with SNARE-associated domain